jgi:riboflavin kinase/FMN adenylyltransferase
MKPASLQGVVTQFKGNGRKLGYPTANITTSTNLDDGVYFGYADLANYTKQPALIFIGTPTTMGDTDRRVEAYLLDIPDKDHYGEELNLSIEHFHRKNETFNNVDALLAVMAEDEVAARQYFPKRTSSGIVRA